MPKKNETHVISRHLSRQDPKLAQVISQIGAYGLKPHRLSLFDSLARAIIYQQLSGKAASTIYGRLRTAAPDVETMSKMSLEQFRATGVSRSKSLALLDLSEKVLNGVLPPMEKLRRLKDDEIIECLIQVRGIGPWSAQMFLMFRLHRPDVLPVADYGVRKAFARLYGKRKLPTPDQLAKHAEIWRPYRTAACWYLWRSLDGGIQI